MGQVSPKILALDFDGVICDGLLEYFQTTQRTYHTIWQDETNSNLEKFADQFYRLRPVIETGWEMPVLLRALVLGISEPRILNHWAEVLAEIISCDRVDKKFIMQQLDHVRDEWINQDLDSWLGLHRFYPGVIKRLQQILNSEIKLYIISTKEGRFIERLLHEQGLLIDSQFILGKEVKQPKYETLHQLLNRYKIEPEQLWFVEDLLKTLQLIVKQTDLNSMGLYLADWGYNTQAIRDSIKNNSQIKLLSLNQFQSDFSFW
ncbi:MAG: HAD family hydrolase [Snowella sp.]|nr:HAD family hydrolase [Snowella sp.]